MQILQIYKSIGTDFLNFLFPPICIICNTSGSLLCEICKAKLREQKHECHICKKYCDEFIHSECKQFSNLDGLFIGYKYSKMIELIVQDLKYHFHSQSAKVIAELILNSNQGKVFESIVRNSPSNIYLVPVPLHKNKKNLRGFNQAELIAREIRSYLKSKDDIDIKSLNLLKRMRNTKTQVGMNRQQRIENLKDVFELDNSNIASLGKLASEARLKGLTQRSNDIFNFILIDDIYTTGTTMEECTKVIKSEFASCEVYGLVFARG